MKKIDKIKELTAKKIWVAPLAGITDNSYRTILKDCEAIVAVGCIIGEIPCVDHIDIDQIKTGMQVTIDGENKTVEIP